MRALPGKLPIMMVVTDSGEPCDTYVKILRDQCPGEYSFLKTSKAIVGPPKMGMRGHVYEGHSIKGFSDGDPIVGQAYTINNSAWHTSTVERIIEDCVLITKNSVYAIHDPARIRDKKLGELGI